MLAGIPALPEVDLVGLVEMQMKMILTRYLSDHSLRDPPVRQEGLNLLFDHSAIPPTSREENLQLTTKTTNVYLSNSLTLLNT